MKKRISRVIAWLLAICMVIGLLPAIPAKAEGEGATQKLTIKVMNNDGWEINGQVIRKIDGGTVPGFDYDYKLNGDNKIWTDIKDSSGTWKVHEVDYEVGEVIEVFNFSNIWGEDSEYAFNQERLNTFLTDGPWHIDEGHFICYSAPEGGLTLEVEVVKKPSTSGKMTFQITGGQYGEIKYSATGEGNDGWYAPDETQSTADMSFFTNGKAYIKYETKEGGKLDFDDFEHKQVYEVDGKATTLSYAEGSNIAVIDNIDTSKDYNIKAAFVADNGNAGGGEPQLGDILFRVNGADEVTTTEYSFDGENWTGFGDNDVLTASAINTAIGSNESKKIYIRYTLSDGQKLDDYVDDNTGHSNNIYTIGDTVSELFAQYSEDKTRTTSFDYDSSKKTKVELRFMNRGGDNPGPDGPGNYDGPTKTSILSLVEGADCPDLWINDVECFREGGLLGEVTYPYNEENGDLTPKENDKYLVKFTLNNFINEKYTAITINGVDYSDRIIGANAKDANELRWAILDAMGDNTQLLTTSIWVPASDSYSIETKRVGIGSDEDPDKENADSYFPLGNFLWTNIPEMKYDDRGNLNDSYLDSTTIEFVSFTYTDREGDKVTLKGQSEIDNANKAYLSFSDNPDNGGATLIAGGELTVRMIPRYGYQVVEFGPNGESFETGEEVGVYTFVIRSGNVHLGAKCEPIQDKVEAKESDAVNGGSIELGKDELDVGSALLVIDNKEATNTEIEEYNSAVGDYCGGDILEVSEVMDINLEQVVYKGTPDEWWSEDKEQLEGEATITLELANDIYADEDTTPVVVHDARHGEEGSIEVIETDYNPEENTITFKTDSFSTYAIAVSKENKNLEDGIHILGIDENGYEYTGTAIKPEITVADGKKILEAGKDYTVSYKNNIKVNDASVARTAPTVTVVGRGNYVGTFTETFKIEPYSFSEHGEGIFVEMASVVYNKREQKPIPVVTLNGKTLKKNVDYKVDHYYSPDLETELQSVKEPGEYTFTVVGINNYCDEIYQESCFYVVDTTKGKLMSKVPTGKIADKEYTGKEIKLSEEELKAAVKGLELNKDYYVEGYRDNVEVGTAKVCLVGINDSGYFGQKVLTFRIKGINIASAKPVGLQASYEYMPWGVWPAIDNLELTVNKEKKTLNACDVNGENGDFTIEFAKNDKVGVATIMFIGHGKYTGVCKKTFRILPADVTKMDSASIEEFMDSLPYHKGGTAQQIGDIVMTKTIEEGVDPIEFVAKAGTDYVAKCTANTTVTTDKTRVKPTLTITFKGNYKGKITKTYDIVPGNLSAQCGGFGTDVAYKKAANNYTNPFVITDNGKKLAVKTDYTVKYQYVNKTEVLNKNKPYERMPGSEAVTGDIVPAGTVMKLIVTGSGNTYAAESSLTFDYEVSSRTINSAKVVIKNKAYTGKSVKINPEDITVTIGRTTLEYGKDYTLEDYSNNVNKGRANVVVRGIGEYNGAKQVTFNIVTKSIKK